MGDGIRCSECSRLFDGEDELNDHACTGDNVTVLVVKPSDARDMDVNAARAYESREEAEEAAEGTDAHTRMIDAPLIPAREDQ